MPPSLSLSTASTTWGPIQSAAISTGEARISERRLATGASLSPSTTFPPGRPRCEQRITLASLSVRYLMVGSTFLMRVSSLMVPVSISKGTLKSTRTSTRFPLTSISLKVFLFIFPLCAPTFPLSLSLPQLPSDRHRIHFSRSDLPP